MNETSSIFVSASPDLSSNTNGDKNGRDKPEVDTDRIYHFQTDHEENAGCESERSEVREGEGFNYS